MGERHAPLSHSQRSRHSPPLTRVSRGFATRAERPERTSEPKCQVLRGRAFGLGGRLDLLDRAQGVENTAHGVDAVQNRAEYE
jgi:hypothetical protein